MGCGWDGSIDVFMYFGFITGFGDANPALSAVNEAAAAAADGRKSVLISLCLAK